MTNIDYIGRLNMNFYLDALQDEHIILSKVLKDYKEQIEKITPVINRKLKSGEADKIILAGMGSSLYAAKSIVAKLNKAGIFTIDVNAFETLHFNSGIITDKSIIVLISQSGNTEEILELYNLIENRAALTISMLNLENSLLKGKCEYELLLKMGKETPISNKSYYGQVAMLNIFAAALVGEDLDITMQEIEKIIQWADDYVNNQDEFTNKLIEFIGNPENIDILGDDAALGAALQTGLVWRECIMMSLSVYSSSDYSHGWYDTVNEDTLVIFLTNKLNILEKKVFDYSLNHGAKVLLFSPEKQLEPKKNLLHFKVPNIENSMLPMYFIVPCYFVAGLLMKSDENK